VPTRQPSQGELDVVALLVDIKTDIGELSGTMRAHVEHDREHQARVEERLDRLEQARTADATGALAAVKGNVDKTKDMLWKAAGALGIVALGAAGTALAHALGWK
jgi:hypothetical protein